MSNKLTVFCIIGKSGSGKDSILKKLLSLNPNLNVLVPYTTRPMREGEVDGVDYNFIDEDIYKKMHSEKKFIEERSYDVTTEDGKNEIWYYATSEPKKDFTIIIGTLEVFKTLKTLNKYKIIPIYIDLPEEDRLYRLIQREMQSKYPNFKELSRRFVQDTKDFSLANRIKLGIDSCGAKKPTTFYNYDLESVSHYINDYIKTEYMNKMED